MCLYVRLLMKSADKADYVQNHRSQQDETLAQSFHRFQVQQQQNMDLLKGSAHYSESMAAQMKMWQQAYMNLQQEHFRLLNSFQEICHDRIDTGQLVLNNTIMEQRIQILEQNNSNSEMSQGSCSKRKREKRHAYS